MLISLSFQIKSLGPALISEDDRTRTRGVMLLAEVRRSCPYELS